MKWRDTTLGEVADLLSGGTPSKDRSEYWGGEIPWVSAKDLKCNYISKSELHLTELGVANGTKVVPENTILFVVRWMSLANEFRISLAKVPVAFNQDLKALRITEDVEPSFLFYALYSKRDEIRQRTGEAAHGTKKLETEVVKAIEIKIPYSSADQKKFSSIAETYDLLIVNNQRRIQLLEQSARLLYREWFVHLRYPGHERDVVVGGIPRGWAVKALKDVAITNAESYSARSLPHEINYIDISSVQGGRILQRARIRAEEAPGRARRAVRDGDIIWSNVRPNLRQFALIVEPQEGDVVSTGFTAITPKSVPSSFLYVAITTDTFVAHLVNHTTGVSYPAVRPEDFERAELLIPRRELLSEFNSHCEPIFRLAFFLEAQNKKLAQARDLLLPRLMDGRISL
jgi:type I restriction enzyme, S subunit